MKNKNIFIGVILLGIIVITLSFTKASADADSVKKNRYIKSVQIESDETVWSIAKETIEQYDMEISIKKLIKEIEEINGINADYVHEGAYIIVPYYE